MLALLKSKSKYSIEHNPRKKFEVLSPSKRMKPDPAQAQPMQDVEEAKEPLKEKDKRRKKIAPQLIERFDQEQD